MSNAKFDENNRPTITCTSSGDGVTIVPIKAEPISHSLLVDIISSSVFLIDSYSEINKDQDVNLWSTLPYVGQSFTTLNSFCNLNSCKFYNKRLGAIIGNAYALLYLETDTTYGIDSMPIGSPLATSDPIDVSILSASSYQLVTYTFTGANKVLLTLNTHYVIVLKYSGGSAGARLRVGVQQLNSPSAAGNLSLSSDGTTWSPISLWDACFYVYGTDSDNGNNLNNAMLDENSVPVWTAESSAGDGKIIEVYGNVVTGEVLISG